MNSQPYPDMATGIAAGIRNDINFTDLLITVERIAPRRNLERILLPSTVACWLAKRWSAGALPAFAVHRVTNWWRRIRG